MNEEIKEDVSDLMELLETTSKKEFYRLTIDHELVVRLYNYITNLQQENQKYKEVIDKVSSQIKLYGKYNGEKCTRGFSVMTADFNKLLDILKEVE